MTPATVERGPAILEARADVIVDDAKASDVRIPAMIGSMGRAAVRRPRAGAAVR